MSFRLPAVSDKAREFVTSDVVAFLATLGDRENLLKVPTRWNALTAAGRSLARDRSVHSITTVCLRETTGELILIETFRTGAGRHSYKVRERWSFGKI